MNNMFGDLLTIAFDITYNCNLRCLHCYNSSGEQSYVKKQLENHEIFEIIRDIAEIKGLDTVCLCGGEPLLKKDILLECIKYLRFKNDKMSINFVTNGILLDEQTVIEIKEAGVTVVQVSLDGFDDETHDWVRNSKGVYDKAVAAIKLLVKYHIPVSVACLPIKKNFDDIPQIIQMLEELGVYEFRMQPLMVMGRAKENMKGQILSDEEYSKISRYLNKCKKEYISKKRKMMIEWGDPIQHLAYMPKKSLKSLHIDAYGEILLSPYLPLIVGDLRKHSLMDYFNNGLSSAWDLDIVNELAKRITSPNKMDLSPDSNSIFNDNIIIYDIL